MMMFVMGLPIFQIILFCLTIGKDPVGLHFAVVNHELSSENQNCTYMPTMKFEKPCELVTNTTTNTTYCPYPEYDCTVNMLSCQFLESLERRNQKMVLFITFSYILISILL